MPNTISTYFQDFKQALKKEQGCSKVFRIVAKVAGVILLVIAGAGFCIVGILRWVMSGWRI